MEWTIKTIQTHPTWKATVVYGDTDSVFIQLKGRTKNDAFLLGQEIATYITNKNPADVILKFEKVYFPCILISKKRYIGCMYENILQKNGNLEAKGLEIARRDQCKVTIKIQEKVIRILFSTRNILQVKEYLIAEWIKLLQGGDKLLLKDFIFSKEVSLNPYYSI